MEIINVDEQILLRLIKMEDAPVIFETINAQREYLGKWLPFVAHTKKIKDTEQFISLTLEASGQGIDLVFVILFENKFAGIIGFRGTDYDNRKTELGYWLSESFQGRGIVTKSLNKLIDYAFNALGMNRLMIRCAVGNNRSKRIPEILDFKFEGLEREGELLNDGNFVDLEVYSLLKGDIYK